MNELQQKQTTFLEDTVEHYKTHKRGLDDRGNCCYAAGCAIGRHLSTEACKKLDKSTINSVSSDNVFDTLPKRLKRLGRIFLARVQYLHDSNHNWLDTTITDAGMSEVATIKRLIADGSLKA